MRQTTNLSNLIKELEGVLPKILNAEKKVYLQTVLRRLRVATMMLWE
jgi:hypothetical protein